MVNVVPTLSIICMALAALVGVVIPVVLFIVFRKRYEASIKAFFVGFAVFIGFALILEAMLHRIILSSAIGQEIQGNIWLYAIYGGLMAGIFEESGRFIAFKTILRKQNGNDGNALMYGAGHGGCEAFLLVTVSMVSYIVMAVMLNAGMSETMTAGVTDETTLMALEATFASLAETPPPLFLVGIFERLAAVAIHISLSVLVWFAAKSRARFWLFPLAVGLHMLVDVIAVVLSKIGLNVWIIEGVLYVIAAGYIMIARAEWKKNISAQADPVPIADTGSEV